MFAFQSADSKIGSGTGGSEIVFSIWYIVCRRLRPAKPALILTNWLICSWGEPLDASAFDGQRLTGKKGFSSFGAGAQCFWLKVKHFARGWISELVD
jgi:hypothetical protein